MIFIFRVFSFETLSEQFEQFECMINGTRLGNAAVLWVSCLKQERCWNLLLLNHPRVLVFPDLKDNIINYTPALAVLMSTVFCLKHYGDLMYFVPSRNVRAFRIRGALTYYWIKKLINK